MKSHFGNIQRKCFTSSEEPDQFVSQHIVIKIFAIRYVILVSVCNAISIAITKTTTFGWILHVQAQFKSRRVDQEMYLLHHCFGITYIEMSRKKGHTSSCSSTITDVALLRVGGQ